MLSQEIKACYRRKELPLLPAPINVRVVFKKVGNLQYISHLDLQRTLHRILVRAGIPMWYTQGFNPHAKIVFSTPLSVGAQSVCEMVDIRIDRDMPCEEIKNLLNREVTDELRILDVYVPQSKFSDIVWASYDIELSEKDIAGRVDDVKAVLAKEHLYAMKKTKSGEKEVDITKFIKKLDINVSEGKIVINTILSTGSTENLNPEYLINAMRDSLGILDKSDLSESYTIMRNRFLLEDMSLFM